MIFMNIIKKHYIKKFIKTIDKDIKVKFQKYDIECDIYDDIVYIGEIREKETVDPLFMKFVHELNPDCNCSCFLLSILHEVGHIMTFDEDNMDEKEFLHQMIRMGMTCGDISLEEGNEAYFRIPLEKEATQWAIDFVMLNPDFIKKYEWLGK